MRLSSPSVWPILSKTTGGSILPPPPPPPPPPHAAASSAIAPSPARNPRVRFMHPPPSFDVPLPVSLRWLLGPLLHRPVERAIPHQANGFPPHLQHLHRGGGEVLLGDHQRAAP